MYGQLVQQQGTCPCKQAGLAVSGRVLFRVYCHCTICQQLYRQPYSDVLGVLASAVALADERALRFGRYRLPPSARRGTCAACGAPVVGFMRLAPFLRLAFVPVRNLPRPAEVPPPMAHIFYHRRKAEVADALPKVSGYWPSQLLVTRTVLANLRVRTGGEG